MSTRLSRFAAGLSAVAAVVLSASYAWAIFYELAPSKDDWKMKFEVGVNAEGEKLNVEFAMADEGRLKPIHSVTLIVFSPPDSGGARTYVVKAPFEFKPTEDGKRVGNVKLSKELADRALIRVLTLNVDGKRNAMASYYDMPLKRFLDKAAPQSPAVASPPGSKVTK